MTNTIYSFGYEKRPVSDLLSESKRLEAVVIDIRYHNWSRIPEWCGPSLQMLLGPRYEWVPELGYKRKIIMQAARPPEDTIPPLTPDEVADMQALDRELAKVADQIVEDRKLTEKEIEVLIAIRDEMPSMIKDIHTINTHTVFERLTARGLLITTDERKLLPLWRRSKITPRGEIALNYNMANPPK